MQFAIYVPDELGEKINKRLARNVKISPLAKWLLMGLVLNKKEIQEFCEANEEEARTVQPFLVDALRNLYDALDKGGERGKTK